MKIEVNQCICVDVHSDILRFIGIFTVYIPVFLRYVGLLVYNFLLDINTGMAKIPSFRFFCGISPSSIWKKDWTWLTLLTILEI